MHLDATLEQKIGNKELIINSPINGSIHIHGCIVNDDNNNQRKAKTLV